MVKVDHRKKVGPFQPIPPPERKLSQIIIDLVTDLLEVEGYMVVVVYIDHLTLMVHYALCAKELTTPKYAKIFVDTIFCHYGLPDMIISDRDPRFTSTSWTPLFKFLDMGLWFSISFYHRWMGSRR